MAYENILEKAREIGQMIKDSELYTQYQAAKVVKEADAELNAAIGEFNLKRIDILREMEKPDRDEEQIARLNEQLKQAYQKVMDRPSMQAFLAAQQDVQEMLNQINSIINYYIEGEQGCSPSQCSSCGGGCNH